MNFWVAASVLCSLISTTLAGGYGGGHGVIILAGHGGGHGGGYGGGFGGGLGGYSKVVPGPSFLVNTVHRVHKLNHGGALVGVAQHGGEYGGGFGGGLGGGYRGRLGGGHGGGYGGGYGGGHGGYGGHGW